MSLRVCAEDGCPNLQPETRCVKHRRQREQQRGSSTQRGYGAPHQRLRAHYQRRMDAGETFTCWRCPEMGRPPHTVDPADWHLGHNNNDRTMYRGPQCPASNQATATGRIARDA